MYIVQYERAGLLVQYELAGLLVQFDHAGLHGQYELTGLNKYVNPNSIKIYFLSKIKERFGDLKTLDMSKYKV